MASSPQYTYPQPPPPAPHQRLPSIKELHFDKMEHARPARPEWARPSPPNLPPQHQMSMPPPHESPKTQYPHSPAPPKMAEQYASSNMPPPQQTGHSSMGPGPSRGEASSQGSSKRPRSGSDASVGVSPGRSHASYAPQHAYPSQHPSPSFQAGPPVPVPPPHDSVHPPAPFTHPPPPYAYPHPHMVQRHYAVPSQVPQHMPPPNTYPPPVTPHEHWQHHPPPPPPPPPYATFPRPSGMAPPNMDPRAAMPPPPNTVDVNARQRLLAEIHEHCRVLQDFAHHYGFAATLQASQPNIQPSPQEMQDMSWRANIVNRLIEDLRRTQDGGGSRDSVAAPSNATSATDETPRPPKRPWEDMSRDEAPASNGNYPEQPQSQYLDVADKTTAEADMEIIRSKRATSTGGNAPGQPKSKYRKRSRATPPGKCHSCNIRETPEWRRGPDGARTLCNACGLHYAKLMRKREKGADGKTIPIDLQTLRASTQSARGTDPEQSHPAPVQQHHPHPNPNVVPYEQPKQQQQQQQQQPPPAHANHHPGHPSPHPHPHGAPYQLMPVNSGPSHPNSQAHQMMPPPPPPPVPAQQTHGETGLSVPPPPWMTSSSSSSSSGRSVYQSDHQSYMRTSHPPSHARASPQ
ncbi:hypothetical protein IEO21_02491 [Rhodonia placenta]|uniref:GATA-type domain-containing protein n=1 Tax=Rhodonia placenta TaxID=104341 RepID=A0A8H7U4A3_9APHY|nr:hypothetical protein IEO21_02491 [Postia placenta]